MPTERTFKQISSMLLFTAMAAVPASTAIARQPHIAPIQSHPHGQTYSEWAADWWQVALETPASVNPFTDAGGENCDQGDMGNVWFLFGSLAPATIERSCEIPVGTALFFPLVNVFYGAFLNDPPETRTEEFIREQVECAEEAAPTLLFTFNGDPVPGLDRFFERSVIFDVQLPEDNILDLTEAVVPNLELSPSVDAGFYLFLQPLPPGSYELHWEGSTEACSFPVAQDVTYHLTIKPGRRR
jgi:hypothetical protein